MAGAEPADAPSAELDLTSEDISLKASANGVETAVRVGIDAGVASLVAEVAADSAFSAT